MRKYRSRIKCGTTIERWMVKWDSTNQLDGRKIYLSLFDWKDRSRILTFSTRRECVAHIKERHGYIASRRDLRVEPHCWRMPKAVRVTVTVAEL